MSFETGVRIDSNGGHNFQLAIAISCRKYCLHKIRMADFMGG
jgi:hypothetical protein